METEFYQVEPFDEFEKQVKRLTKKKRFYTLPAQVEELRDKLLRGDFDEPPIFRLEDPAPVDVYKVRLPNPDANVGKSGGYRVVYMVVTERRIVVLLCVYYKKEQEDVTDTYVMGLIDGYFLGALPYDDD